MCNTNNFDQFEDRSRELLAQSGQSTLNALLVMNGGATAAFLAFLTPLVDKGKFSPGFALALTFFVVGLVAVVIAFATIHVCILSVRYYWHKTANWFYVFTFLLGCLSGGLFIAGSIKAMNAVKLSQQAAVNAPAPAGE